MTGVEYVTTTGGVVVTVDGEVIGIYPTTTEARVAAHKFVQTGVAIHQSLVKRGLVRES